MEGCRPGGRRETLAARGGRSRSARRESASRRQDVGGRGSPGGPRAGTPRFTHDKPLGRDRAMRVGVLLAPQEGAVPPSAAAVVIDVLRATSTLSAARAHGAARIV